jgi:hypothetical protein
MEKVMMDMDSLILEIFKEVRLDKEERAEADKVIDSIISLYSPVKDEYSRRNSIFSFYSELGSPKKEEPKRRSWWLNSNIDIPQIEEPKPKSWWSRTKAPTSKKSNKLRILT